MVGVGLEDDRAPDGEHGAGAGRRARRRDRRRRAIRGSQSRTSGCSDRDLRLGHVGRVRDDEVERAGEPVEQARLDERDREPEPLGVLTGECERVRRHVGGDHGCARMLVGDRERDRPTTGADIDHLRLVEPGDRRERPLDDDLRLRPRARGRARRSEA